MQKLESLAGVSFLTNVQAEKYFKMNWKTPVLDTFCRQEAQNQDQTVDTFTLLIAPLVTKPKFFAPFTQYAFTHN